MTKPKGKQITSFDPQTFLDQVGSGKTTLTSLKKQISFRKGMRRMPCSISRPARSSSQSCRNKAKKPSSQYWRVSFFGEGCLAGSWCAWRRRPPRKTATLVRIEKPAMIRVLHDEPAFSELFLTYLLTRNKYSVSKKYLGGSTLQFQRETAGAGAAVNGPFWERRQAGAGCSKGQSGNARRDDRHDALPCQFLHE